MQAQFLFDALSIVLIDLVLGGDNAVVIAMAVRGLPQHQRRRGIALGAGLAVGLRVLLTFFAARLLGVPWVQLAGGIVILWIAVKLFADSGGEAEAQVRRGFWRAVSYIVVADITMSLDNVLAIAAASHGSLALLLAGLGLSIPFVVYASSLLANLMDRYQAILYAGAAILGRVGAEMILTDRFVQQHWSPGAGVQYTVEALVAVAVAATGWWLSRRVSR